MNFFDKTNFFLIGIAGSGMSAIAQFLRFSGKNVSGSDRLFKIKPEAKIRKDLENIGIKTYAQGSSKLNNIDVVVVSTAIETNVFEYRQAVELGIPIIHRSEMLEYIAQQYISIAVAGTSGKSTTTAMVFHLLNKKGLSPSLITASPILTLQKKYLIANAYKGDGNILVYEADESDGSILNYRPSYSLLLNIAKDHKNIAELQKIFKQFFINTQRLKIKNADDPNINFSADRTFGKKGCSDFIIDNFKQVDFKINFTLNNVAFKLNTLGEYNAYNCAGAVALANEFGVSLKEASNYMLDFQGIRRRMEIIGKKNGTIVIDDYAHNPAKIKAAISAIKLLNKPVVIFFQPHGFSPLRFMFNEFLEAFSENLKQEDTLIVAPVYYAGGTISADINSQDLVKKLQKRGVNAKYQTKEQFLSYIKKLDKHSVIIIAGARDPFLNDFARAVYDTL